MGTTDPPLVTVRTLSLVSSSFKPSFPLVKSDLERLNFLDVLYLVLRGSSVPCLSFQPSLQTGALSVPWVSPKTLLFSRFSFWILCDVKFFTNTIF